MEFYPTNQIIICKGVCLDPSYKHTLTFSTESAQENYFLNKKKFVVDDASYTRATGRIKIKKNAEQLWDCSYLMFQNRDYGSKWFYAFITDVLFLSESSSEISFQIDVVQTWYFDYNIQSCFVEREHTNNDAIGVNVLPENVDIGDYVFSTNNKLFNMDNMCIIVACTFFLPAPEESGNKIYARMLNNIYSGCTYFTYNTTSAGVELLNLHLELAAQAGKSDGIVAMYMLPTYITGTVTDGAFLEGSFAPKPAEVPKTYNLDGYTAKNNKLYTYPYNFLTITNNQGNDVQIKYELSSLDNVTFSLIANQIPTSTVMIYPLNYRGIDRSFGDALQLGGFPICSWSSSLYANYVAQNRGALTASLIGTTARAGASLAEGGSAVSVGASVVSQVASLMGKYRDVSVLPPSYKGNVDGDILSAFNYKTFYAMHTSIRREYAQSIDNYFSMFGYATNKVKVPNITGRSSWNYVKTINSTVCGNCPGTVLREVEEILNNGITYWHGDYVGDYSRSNSII